MPKRSTRFYRKNEAEVMKSLGFKPTKNSGSGWIEKEDGLSKHCICQLKSTDKRSISVNLNDIQILNKNATICHKTPVFAIQYLLTGETYLLIKPSDIMNLQDIINGIEPKEKEESFLEESLDSEEDLLYNKTVIGANSNKVSKNYNARKEYQLKQAERYNEQRASYKKKARERWQKKER